MNLAALGFYQVGDRVFYNKIAAMTHFEKTGIAPVFNLGDEVFSKIDWRVPIETSLPELYRQRALQLREKYDFISLFYSGGADSTNTLHAFIDNDIHLDEVVMYMPKPLDRLATTRDTNHLNIYSEVVYAALPHLRSVLKNPRTKVRILDMCEATSKLLENEALVEQYQGSVSMLSNISVPRLAFVLTDPIWQSLYEKGKTVCHLQSADKPMVKFSYEHGYTFQFQDFSACRYEPAFSTSDSEMRSKHQFQEMFYWTPSLPELVIKQCQVVKKRALIDISLRMLLSINADSLATHGVTQDKFTMLNNLVYSQHTLAARNLFSTGKTTYNSKDSPWGWVEAMGKETHGKFTALLDAPRCMLGGQSFRSRTENAFFTPKSVIDTDKISDKYAILNFKTRKYTL